jgi:hypothetical protein
MGKKARAGLRGRKPTAAVFFPYLLVLCIYLSALSFFFFYAWERGLSDGPENLSSFPPTGVQRCTRREMGRGGEGGEVECFG